MDVSSTKGKKWSTSSGFSMRDYSVRKCAVESDRVVAVLIKFCNIVIKCNHCPSRWSKVADVMLEKRQICN